MTVKDVIAEFLNPDYQQIISPFRLKRIDSVNGRMYANYNEKLRQYLYYLSVTEFCSRSLPTATALKKYIGDLGTETAGELMWKAAEYGTFLHIQCVSLMLNGSYRLGELEQIIEAYLIENHLPMTCRYEWYEKSMNDISAFFQFLIDKKVRIIAIEFPIISPKYGLGGCIDIVVELMFNGKMQNAIIDIKSGRKGFWDSHELQLQTYKTIWNEIYGAICPVDLVFNWSPKDWNKAKEPTYNFVNQTDSKYGKSILSRLEVCKLEEWVTIPKGALKGIGTLDLSKENLRECIEVMDYSKILGELRNEV